jgi:hypothetical protein
MIKIMATVVISIILIAMLSGCIWHSNAVETTVIGIEASVDPVTFMPCGRAGIITHKLLSVKDGHSGSIKRYCDDVGLFTGSGTIDTEMTIKSKKELDK